MSERFPDLHDYLLRVPKKSWTAFEALVQGLRPRRSINQQIVHLLEEFVKKEKKRQAAEE